jgi:hypothetical protein
VNPRQLAENSFRLGDWVVQPSLNRLCGPSGEVHLEPRAMSLLVLLAKHAGAVVQRRVIDLFGHYRIDRLPPGTSLLRAAPSRLKGAEPPTHEVMVSDDVFFGQDLALPFELPEEDPLLP